MPIISFFIFVMKLVQDEIISRPWLSKSSTLMNNVPIVSSCVGKSVGTEIYYFQHLTSMCYGSAVEAYNFLSRL